MASSSVHSDHYKQFVLLTAASMQERTLGQALAKAVTGLYKSVVPAQDKSKRNMIEILDQIIDHLNGTKKGIMDIIAFCKENTPNQIKADLLGVMYAATSTYATKDCISFEDEIFNWKWALEIISNALRDNTLDGTEADPDEGSGGESGYEGDKDNF